MIDSLIEIKREWTEDGRAGHDQDQVLWLIAEVERLRAKLDDAVAAGRKAAAEQHDVYLEQADTLAAVRKDQDRTLEQRDAAQAENKRLRMQYENLSRECLGQYESLSAEIERLRSENALRLEALQDVVASTGGGLIAQDYGRLNRALQH